MKPLLDHRAKIEASVVTENSETRRKWQNLEILYTVTQQLEVMLLPKFWPQ